MRLALLSMTSLLAACGGGPGADPTRANPPAASSEQRRGPPETTSTAQLSSAEPPSKAASIFTKRKLYLRRPGAGSSCEAWDVEVASLLDETHGKLRRPAGPGEVRVMLDVERRGAELSLGAPCYGIEKEEVCLPCPESPPDAQAYARLDDCEEGAPARSAPLSGCVAALGSAALENARRTLDGSRRDALVERIEATRLVSMGSGEDCIEYHVRRSGKRLFLDSTFSEYPEEVTRLTNGALSIAEVPEKNPHFRPKGGLGSIAIGCCGGERYHVLELAKDRATLRTIPHAGGKEVSRIVELRMSGCPAQ